MKNIKQNQIKAPMRYAAKFGKYECDIYGRNDEPLAKVYSASIKAGRIGGEITIFENILFVEYKGGAFIFGIEKEKFINHGLDEAEANNQKRFIDFLRNETKRVNDSLGHIAQIFNGYEYAQEQWATIAYLATREEKLDMALGYYDYNKKKYQNIRVSREDIEELFDFGGGYETFEEWAKGDLSDLTEAIGAQ